MNTAIRKGLGRASLLTQSPLSPTTSVAQQLGQGFVWAVDAEEGGLSGTNRFLLDFPFAAVVGRDQAKLIKGVQH